MMDAEREAKKAGRWGTLSTGFRVAVVGLLLAGCSTEYYRKSADQEAYKIIKARSPKVSNMETNFTIETNAIVALDDLPVVGKVEAELGASGTNEIGCRILPLERALAIAVKNSRTYQTRKENLYIEALSLALTRHRYTPIFGGGASALWKRSAQEGVDGMVEKQSAEVQGNVGLDLLMSTGARLATDFTMDFQRFFLGGPGTVTSSALSASLTQPLLRGRGYKVTMENLTQGERDLLYALRDFVRFRKDFTVQIVSAYYNVLRSRDQVRNAWLGLQATRTSAIKSRAQFNEGRTRMADLSRYEQNTLNNESVWIGSVRGYKQSLDSFKLTLGLPIDAQLVLDGRELTNLKIQHPPITAEEATRIALVSRLDFYTTRDQFADAARKIDLAANGLKADLDAVLQANVPSKPGSGIPELDFRQTQVSGGLTVNLPLDRKAERNTYRVSLITYDRARRALEQAVDDIKLQILNSWRQLDEAKRQYETSEISVKLAETRVQEQTLLDELGRANSEEVLSAQNDLTAQRNSLTTQLISHVVSRLSLWRDMGVLMIKENGKWEEIEDVKPK